MPREAIWQLLRDPGVRSRQAGEPVVVYDDETVDLLAMCGAVLDGPTGKRLKQALPATLDNLTIDR